MKALLLLLFSGLKWGKLAKLEDQPVDVETYDVHEMLGGIARPHN